MNKIFFYQNLLNLNFTFFNKILKIIPPAPYNFHIPIKLIWFWVNSNAQKKVFLGGTKRYVFFNNKKFYLGYHGNQRRKICFMSIFLWSLTTLQNMKYESFIEAEIQKMHFDRPNNISQAWTEVAGVGLNHLKADTLSP